MRYAKYQAVDVFKTGMEVLNHINVSDGSNCSPKNILAFDMNRNYIGVANHLKNIDILAIKPSSHQAIKPSSHQAIKPSSPSGELIFSDSGGQKTKNQEQYIGMVK